MQISVLCEHCGTVINRGDPCSFDENREIFWCLACTAYANEITEEEVIAMAQAHTELLIKKPTIH